MPAFDITIEGKTYHVEIPDPGAMPLAVIVDGQQFAVTVQGTQTQVTPRPPAQTPAPAPRPAPEPPHLPAPPRVSGGRPASAAPAGPVNGGSEIVAPMPGTVIGIDVEVGQEVATGDVLCVLEAMKMKTPLRASRPGTVAEIAVRVGQAVAYGDVLIRLA